VQWRVAWGWKLGRTYQDEFSIVHRSLLGLALLVARHVGTDVVEDQKRKVVDVRGETVGKRHFLRTMLIRGPWLVVTVKFWNYGFRFLN
jgi:hypothetical protein